MNKLSFRPRALDASKPMPIYMAEELPDLPEYSAITRRAVPQMPSGMEKEEECVSKEPSSPSFQHVFPVRHLAHGPRDFVNNRQMAIPPFVPASSHGKFVDFPIFLVIPELAASLPRFPRGLPLSPRPPATAVTVWFLGNRAACRCLTLLVSSIEMSSVSLTPDLFTNASPAIALDRAQSRLFDTRICRRVDIYASNKIFMSFI